MVEKRNIVLITIDSLRADHCSFMGYTRDTTPNLDKMARKGIYFENAIVPGVATPVSLYGIFTKEYCPLDPEEKSFKLWRRAFTNKGTLAETLRHLGYKTGAFSPNPRVSRYYGFNKGFDYFEDFISQSKSFFDYLPSPLNKLKLLISKEGFLKSWTTYYDSIISWVEKQNKEFFLWIFLIDTHHPYISPRKFRKYSRLLDIYRINWKAYMQYKTGKILLSIDDKDRVINVYDDSIRFADAFLGKILKDLSDYDPIFIVHSDHGEAFWEHGFYGHTPPNKKYLYEELLRVPLVIYNSDIYIGECISKPVSLIDLSSFILELTKNSEDPLKPLLKREIIVSKVFVEGNYQIAVRIKDWKFIYYYKDNIEFYYLKDDPYEQNNIVGEHPELVKEIMKIVSIHKNKYKEIKIDL